MDKEKQIEEMARILCQNHCTDCTGATCLALLNCKALYEHGYRKIPEDSVVLSRKDYVDTLRESKKQAYEFGCKETAEKISQKIEDSFWMNSNNCYALKLWLKEQFGVEIKN